MGNIDTNQQAMGNDDGSIPRQISCDFSVPWGPATGIRVRVARYNVGSPVHFEFQINNKEIFTRRMSQMLHEC